MVLLYDATTTHSLRWARSAPSGAEAAAVADVQTFDDVLARAHGVVAFVRNEDDDRAILTRLHTFRTQAPLKFLILVHPNDTTLPVSLCADATLSVDDADRTLWQTVSAVEACGILQRLADIVRTNTTIPALLRVGIIHALLRPTPISSIKELAAEVGCDRRTLPRAWEAVFRGESDRLIDFLDWIVLLYVAGRKTPKRSWVLVSRDVGLTEDTLARSARKLVGLSLGELGAQGQPAVLTRFRGVFERLFGQWPSDLSPGTVLHRPMFRVLVVDDHEAIGQFLEHTLQRAGFEVLVAHSGKEALGRLRHTEKLPMVILTDIKMPEMDGFELAKEVARQWPSVRIILMSAFISIDVIQLGWLREDLGRAVQFLSKPFTAGRIIAMLREVCEGGLTGPPPLL